MPDKWTTIAEAASFLKVHPRTVERQIKSGKLQSRRADGGQVEVLIDMPEESAPVADALAVVAGQAENQVQLALSATSALIQSAQEDSRLARQEADTAWREAHDARRRAGIAWSVVGAMAIAVMFAIWWTTRTITQSQSELASSAHQVQMLSDTAGQLRSTNERLASQLSDANQKAAKAEGELAGRSAIDNHAYSLIGKAVQQPPATRPSTLTEKIASLFSTGSK